MASCSKSYIRRRMSKDINFLIFPTHSTLNSKSYYLEIKYIYDSFLLKRLLIFLKNKKTYLHYKATKILKV